MTDDRSQPPQSDHTTCETVRVVKFGPQGPERDNFVELEDCNGYSLVPAGEYSAKFRERSGRARLSRDYSKWRRPE